MHETFIDADNSNGRPFMVDAPAGTGKTIVDNAIAANFGGNGKAVRLVSSARYSALQLPDDWTAHSVFKLPLNDHLKPGAFRNIRSETQRANLIRKFNLIVWDEFPMPHGHRVEVLDRILRDPLQ